MEFDRITIEITQLSDGRWHAIAKGVIDEKLGDGSEKNEEREAIEIYNEQVKELGSVTSRDRSTLIDWFIEKVEEA